MLGTLYPGDFLDVECVAPSLGDLRCGDVVMYRRDRTLSRPGFIAHRVVTIRTDGVSVQGDSSVPHAPEFVQTDRIIGRVTHLERNGRRHTVARGLRGRLHAWRMRVLLTARARVSRRSQGVYDAIRRRGVVRKIWRPRVISLRLQRENEVVFKYLVGRRIVARWYPDHDRWECRKPYDLVLSPNGQTA